MITVKSKGVETFRQRMDAVSRKQMPFAASVALNKTAFGIKKVEDSELIKAIDTPTPFTKKAIRVQTSTKKRLHALVFIAPIQAGYLRYLVHGGTRSPENRAIPYPVGQKVNKYGNIPRRAIARMRANRRMYFSGTPKGRTTPGLYKRVGSSRSRGGQKLKLMVSYQKRARYQKHFDFYKIAGQTAKKIMNKSFREAAKIAMKSKR